MKLKKKVGVMPLAALVSFFVWVAFAHEARWAI